MRKGSGILSDSVTGSHIDIVYHNLIGILLKTSVAGIGRLMILRIAGVDRKRISLLPYVCDPLNQAVTPDPRVHHLLERD